MEFSEYTRKAAQTDGNRDAWYYALGIAGEAGEVAEKVKKLYRDMQAIVTDEFRASVRKELGDILWYIDRLANKFGFTLEDVARENNIKTLGRLERNTIHGNGDDR